ncbi:MAG: putative toxin-antitoxin system toxin component, PIN family [Acidobacteria bacterium]|nr:putative toxin-antitoxin system toxin component, PIN family [Acidobacteriota bacterium]
MRIVLDTNILVRAAAKGKGPASELLRLITDSPEHVLLLSPFLLQELERVFSYDRVRFVTKLTDQEIAEYLSYLRAGAVSEIVFPGPAPIVVAADPDDDPVVHTAVAGQADVLCTLNRHFYHPDVVNYCNARGVLLANDVDVLNLLRGLPHQPS